MAAPVADKIINRKTRARAYYLANRERILFKNRAYNAANPAKVLANAKKVMVNLRRDFLAAYGGSCTCCGEQTPEFLTLEHIGGGGREHRARVGSGANIYRELKRAGWPKDKYTLLCMNCNWAGRKGHLCPHKQQRLLRSA